MSSPVVKFNEGLDENESKIIDNIFHLSLDFKLRRE
jgi:hypothetical protein